MRLFVLPFLFYVLFQSVQFTYSQETDSTVLAKTLTIDTMQENSTITAEKDFEAGWIHGLIFGRHWRDLWTTPISVPVLNMNKFGGGLELTPGEFTGGKQSKVLKFNAADGRVYKFRSTLKFAKFAIDPELRGTIGEYIIQDQISIKHPYAPIIAFNLLKKTGVLMPEPKMYVLPYDSKLNGYPDYKGLLGTIQEMPGEDKKPFEGLTQVIKTAKLLKKLDKDPANRVEGAEFLKARLMDIFMSDWDRHHKQWLWGKTETDSVKKWIPISQDRDEAFCRYDGLVPWLFAEAVPRFEGISDNYPLIDYITWEGRYLDRRFLTSVTKAEWISTANNLKSQLTNSAIHDAVSLTPAVWYKFSGKKLEKILRSRRNKINEIAKDYYELIFSEPDLWASDKNETVDISALNEDILNVKITQEGSAKPYYERAFDINTTSEIRIYLQGGDDKVFLKGNRPNNIKVRIIGGEGNDEVTDETNTKNGGSLDAIFYTNGKPVAFKETEHLSVNGDYYKIPKDVIEKINPEPQDYGALWNFFPSLSYNTDEGVVFGGTPVYNRYGFRYNPYKYRLALNGTYATRSRGYYIKFTSDFYSIIKNMQTSLDAEFSGSQFSKFYGLGNGSVLNKESDRNGYYRVTQHIFQIDQLFTKRLKGDISLSAGVTFKSINTADKLNTLISDNFIHQTGRTNYAGLNLAVIFDVHKSKVVPSSSTYARLSVVHFPDLFKNGYNFTKTSFNLSRILFENFMKKSFFKLSLNAEKVFGTYPFYEAVLLGGVNTLRGFAKDRFAGDAALSGSFDLSLYLFNAKILLPADFSLLVITDAGRVFYNNETSKEIHYSYGGGFSLGYFKRLFNLQFYAANSLEGAKFYIGAVFGF